jgi:hypothetical protein
MLGKKYHTCIQLIHKIARFYDGFYDARLVEALMEDLMHLNVGYDGAT